MGLRDDIRLRGDIIRLRGDIIRLGDDIISLGGDIMGLGGGRWGCWLAEEVGEESEGLEVPGWVRGGGGEIL